MKETYLLLGASSDIALEFIRELSIKKTSVECKVYATYFSNPKELEALKNSIENIDIQIIRCDLGDSTEIQNLMELIKNNEDIPNYIIHFASPRFQYMRIREFDWDKVKYELDVQVGSLAIICKYFLNDMKMNKFGRVIAIGTEYLLGVPPKFLSDYIISKHALLGLIKAFASENAGSGITFNMISPGMMETKFLDNIDARSIEINAKNSAMKRNVTTSETCSAIFYLLSNLSECVNGINLNLSGGNYM